MRVDSETAQLNEPGPVRKKREEKEELARRVKQAQAAVL